MGHILFFIFYFYPQTLNNSLSADPAVTSLPEAKNIWWIYAYNGHTVSTCNFNYSITFIILCIKLRTKSRQLQCNYGLNHFKRYSEYFGESPYLTVFKILF